METQDDSLLFHILSAGEPPKKPPRYPPEKAHYLPVSRKRQIEKPTEPGSVKRERRTDLPLATSAVPKPKSKDLPKVFHKKSILKKLLLELQESQLTLPQESRTRSSERESLPSHYVPLPQMKFETIPPPIIPEVPDDPVQIKNIPPPVISPPVIPQEQDEEIEDYIPEEIYQPENVEPVLPLGLESKEKFLDTVDNIPEVDQYYKYGHKTPPHVPISEEDICLPNSTARQIFKFPVKTNQLSNMTLYYEELLYNANISELISSPNGFIRYIEALLSTTSDIFLTLPVIQSMNVEDGSLWINYLGEKIYRNYSRLYPVPSALFWAFQISARKKEVEPKTINNIVVTSEIFCCPLEEFLEKFYDTFISWTEHLQSRTGESDYDRFFNAGYHLYEVWKLNIIYFTHSQSGGCSDFSLISKNIDKYVINPPSRNNNCFWAALSLSPSIIKKYKYVKFDNGEEKFERMKLDAQFRQSPGLPVSLDQIRDIAKNLKVHIHVYTEEKIDPVEEGCFNKQIRLSPKNIYQCDDEENNSVASNLLMLKRGGRKFAHYYFLKDLNLLELRSCQLCFRWTNKNSEGFKTHAAQCLPCPVCKQKNSPNHKCRVHRQQRFEKLPKKKYQKMNDWKKNILFADFETIPLQNGVQTPYLAALLKLDDILDYEKTKIEIKKVKCSAYWGEKCMDLFMKDILELPKNRIYTIVFYNGSRFDYYFIINWLIKKKIKFNFSKDEKSNRIPILNIGKIRFMDLCCFTYTSLSAACKSYDVPKEYCKGDFNHNKLKQWSDLALYRDEIINYCSYDVISLGVLYIKMATGFKTDYSLDINAYTTAPHMIYDFWAYKILNAEQRNLLSLPSIKEYEWLRQDLFGGRVYPTQPQYDSEILEDSNYYYWHTYSKEKRQLILNAIKDDDRQLKIYDYTSLYPSAAKNTLFACGNYEWITDEKKFAIYYDAFQYLLSKCPDWKKYKQLILKCFFECDITPPRDLDIPFLMTRDEKGKMHQNLLPAKNQKYSGLILIQALKIGYRLDKIHKILKYGQLHALFKEFMDVIMKKKDEADKNNNQTQRNMAKMGANSVTGKQSEIYRRLVNSLHFTDDFIPFLSQEHLENGDIKIETFFEGQDILGYYVSEIRPDFDYKKCPQLGVLILDQAKCIMLKKMKKLNLLRGDKCYYTDTDSLFVQKSVYDKHKDLPNFWGSQFELLKDEYPDVVWTRAVFWAPKTYALQGIHKKDLELVMLQKAKGAPQPEYMKNPTNKLYYTSILQKTSSQHRKEEDDLRFVIYHRLLNDVIVEESNYLPFEWMDAMITDPEYEVLVLYNSLKKDLNNLKLKDTAAVVRLLKQNHRTFNRNSWWNISGNQPLNEQKRVFVKDFKSVPVGHMLDLNFNKRF